MTRSFNPLDYSIIFSEPPRLTRHSFWQEHIPFGMLLVQLLKPRVLVELGTHYGDSYCAFCHAVKKLNLPAHCYAVDNWQGDEHIPNYGEEVLSDLRAQHDPLYGSFSTLVRSDFDAACANFADGAVDLLHIDGTHTFEAVKHDFETWLPKLSMRGVVLFHDTNVLDRDYGVRKFFDGIKMQYPHFEFLHGYGLGVLAVGKEQPPEFLALLNSDDATAAAIRQLFFQLGRKLTLSVKTRALEAETLQLKTELHETAMGLHGVIAARNADIQSLHDQLNLITNSQGWVYLQKLWSLRALLRPPAAAEGKTPVTDSASTEATTPPISTEVTANASDKEPLPTAPMTVSASAESVKEDRPSYSTEELQEMILRNRPILGGLQADGLRTIAFYLPQFHPIPENDQWWGRGFTEWTNVVKAQPLFEGHYQPHLPADLSFYDLRVPEVREQQAVLAREYGIHGFCYHHYWFGGRRLLERPFNEVLRSGRPDFPFCLCWANENWTRRWDGSEQEILLAQNHSDEDDRNFIRDLFPAFNDARYIRVNGKPLLVVYRANVLPNAARTAAIWREEMKRAGLGELYLCIAQSFGIDDPTPYGFDAAVEFPPHGIQAPNEREHVKGLSPDFGGWIYDYMRAANSLINRPEPEYTLLKTVAPSWDNTPRRKDSAYLFHHASPEAYEYWLGKVIEWTLRHHTGDERLVFINAWNEWGEGAHLEPDRRYGLRFLEATRTVLSAVQAASTPLKARI